MYVKKPPSVSVPARIWRVPTYMTTAPTIPSRTVEERLMTLVDVSVFRTLSRRRCTPAAKTLLLALLGVVALDDAHAAQRLR